MATILLVIVLVFAALGFIAGAVKGYTKSSCWGLSVLFAVLLARAMAGGTNSFGGNGIVVLAVTAGILLLMFLLFDIIKKFLGGKMEKKRLYSHYAKSDERAQREEQILSAIEDGDKKAYKKGIKRKIKESTGIWGIFNWILGGAVVAINAAMYAGIFISFILLIVQFAQISALTEAFSAVLNGGWANGSASLAIDILVGALMCMALRLGYKNGFSNALCTVVILGLLVLAGYLSFHLAFQVEAFAGLAEKMVGSSFGNTLSSLAGFTSMVGLDETKLAKAIIMLILFLLMLVVVIIVGIFLPHLVEKFRGQKTFVAIDGVLGALILFVVIFGLLMFAGGVAYSLNDLSIMEAFNALMEKSPVANGLYANNLLVKTGFVSGLPIRGWFGD